MKNYLKNLLNTNGRLNRQKFLIEFLILIGISFLILIIIFILYSVLLWIFNNFGLSNFTRIINLILGLVSMMVIILMPIIGGIYLKIKRLHDLNHSGWLQLISLIPILGYFFTIYILFFKGTTGPNKYGQDPLQTNYQTIENPNPEMKIDL